MNNFVNGFRDENGAIYFINQDDIRLKGLIEAKVKRLERALIKTGAGINIKIPKKYQIAAPSSPALRPVCETEEALDKPEPYFIPKAEGVGPGQTEIHIEPKKEESIKTIWNLLDDLHRLYCRTHHVSNPDLRRELQDKVNDLNVRVLRSLHVA